MSNRGPSYGLDAELAAKQAAKYDPKMEEEARSWISALTGEKLNGNFMEALKDGTALCKLVNAIKPGSVGKINTGTMAFKQMENINAFLTAAGNLGVPKNDLFQTVDLYEAQNPAQVVLSIHALGRSVQKLPGFNGPALGPKLADSNARHFTQEQINASKAAPTKISQGSHGGATQAGMADHSRDIVKTTSASPASPASPAAEPAKPKYGGSPGNFGSSPAAAPAQPKYGGSPGNFGSTSHASPPAAEKPKFGGAPGNFGTALHSSQAKPSAGATNSPAKPAPSAPTPAAAPAVQSQSHDVPNRGPVYGLDAELAAKQASKFDSNLAGEAQNWLETLSGQRFPADFMESLKDGVILCKAINAIKPGTIPNINTGKMAFKQMENINFFLQAAQSFGVPAADLFQTVDLFEAQNPPQVVNAIHSLGRHASKVPGFKGPHIGPKLADANVRSFSEMQLNAGKAIPSKFSQGSHGGASQAGMHDSSHEIIRKTG